MILANLVSLTSLSMSFVPTYKRTTSGLSSISNNILIKLSAVCAIKWSKKGFTTAQFFIKINSLNSTNVPLTNYKYFLS